jgi:hypothetical protein
MVEKGKWVNEFISLETDYGAPADKICTPIFDKFS